MKKMKKIISLLLVAVFVLAFMAGCAEEGAAPEAGAAAATTFVGKNIDADPIRFAFVSISTSGVTNISYQTAFTEQLSMYPNVTMDYFDGEYNPNSQINAIQECITQKYDCIFLEPLDGQACAPAILEAEAAGIPVITINPGTPAIHSAHVQGNDYVSGQQGAQKLYEAIGDGGKYIILDCPAEAKPNTRMGTGAEDWFTANTDWEKLDHQYIANFSLEVANTTMRDLLTKYDDIDAVYCSTDDIAIGAVQAIEAAGRHGILVWGNTGYYNAFQAIADGTMYGTSWCDVYAQIQGAVSLGLYFVKTGINSVSAGFTETPIINNALMPVTAENVDQLLALSRWEYESEYLG